MEEQIQISKEEFRHAEDNHKIMIKEIGNLKKQVEVIRGHIRDLNNIDGE